MINIRKVLTLRDIINIKKEKIMKPSKNGKIDEQTGKAKKSREG